MAVKEHELFNELLADVMDWAHPKILEELEQKGAQALLEPGSFDGLSPRQQYEFNSYYWCRRLVGIFDKLKSIRTMTGRSPSKKKNESRSVLLEEWIRHNYEYYTVIYQSILDVALLLTNEIFNLGNPYRKCSYSTVCDNTQIKGTSVHRILEKLDKTVRKHREGKNLLLHRGERIKPPIKGMRFEEIEMTNMAIKLGLMPGESEQLLREFLSLYTRVELARQLGVSRSYITMPEQGNGKPSRHFSK